MIDIKSIFTLAAFLTKENKREQVVGNNTFCFEDVHVYNGSLGSTEHQSSPGPTRVSAPHAPGHHRPAMGLGQGWPPRGPLIFDGEKGTGFPGGSLVRDPPANAGHTGSIPGSARCPGGHGNPLQSSFLGNSRDGGAWRATARGVAKSRA